MANEVKMRVNRVVDGELGNRRIREVFLVNTSVTGTQLQNEVQTGTFQLSFIGEEGDDLKWGSLVKVTLDVEEEKNEEPPTPS